MTINRGSEMYVLRPTDRLIGCRTKVIVAEHFVSQQPHAASLGSANGLVTGVLNGKRLLLNKDTGKRE